MGVHDFACAIYSKIKGSQQSLEVMDLRKDPLPDTDLVDDWVKDESENDPELIGIVEETIANNPEERDPTSLILDGYGGDPSSIWDGDVTTAVLEILVYPKGSLTSANLTLKSSVKELTTFLSTHTPINKMYKSYDYCWDAHDFYIEGDDRQYLGYNVNREMESIWILPSKAECLEHKDKCDEELYSLLAEGEVIIRNFTKHAYDNYINAPTVNPLLRNIDLAYVANLFGVDYRGKTRSHVFSSTKANIDKQF